MSYRQILACDGDGVETGGGDELPRIDGETSILSPRFSPLEDYPASRPGGSITPSSTTPEALGMPVYGYSLLTLS